MTKDEKKTIEIFLLWLDLQGFNLDIIGQIRWLLLERTDTRNKWIPTDIMGEYQEAPANYKEGQND